VRRFLILLLLCLGLAGAPPMRPPAAAAMAPAQAGGMGGGHCCDDDGACIHGACLGCAVEPEAPRLYDHRPAPAALPPTRTSAARLPSRPSALDPPPPRRG